MVLASVAHGGETDPRYRAGLGLLNRNLHADAAVELRAFIDDASAGGAADPMELATARYSLALCDAKLGRPADAAKALAQLEPPPGFAFAADALFLQGQCAASAGDHATAVAALEKLIGAHPGFPRLDRAAALRGESLLRAGRSAEAAAALGEMIERWPESPVRDRAEFLCANAAVVTGDDGAAARRLASLRGRAPRGVFTRQATVLEAQCRRRMGEFEPALALHEAALAEIAGSTGDGASEALDRPTRAEMLLGKAACLRALGRHDDCVAACESCLALLATPAGPDGRPASTAPSPGDGRLRTAAGLMMVHARFDRGVALLEQGRADEAGALLESVIAAESATASPDEADERTGLRVAALRALASTAARERRLDDSAAFLGRIAGISGLSSDERAAALADQGATLAAAGRDGDAEAAFRRFLAQHGDSARARDVALRRAMAVARQGRHDDAIAFFESCLAPGVDGAPLDAALRSAAILEYATALLATGRVDEAREKLGGIVDPSTPPTLRAHAAAELARLAVERGGPEDHRQALALLDQVAAARRESAVANAKEPGADPDGLRERELFLRGTCQLKLGDVAAAATTLEAFERECPASSLRAAAMLMRADALLASQEAAAAAKVLAQLVESAPGCAIEAPALLRLGDACAECGQWEGSRAAFDRFLELPPDCESAKPLWHQARFGVAMALEQQGRLVEAIEVYRDVVSRHRGPTAARAQFQVGECLFAAGRHDEAARELLKVDLLFAEPRWSAAALCEAGRCFMELGRSADAKAQFDAVLERYPASPWATMARERRDEIRPASLPGGER